MDLGLEARVWDRDVAARRAAVERRDRSRSLSHATHALVRLRRGLGRRVRALDPAVRAAVAAGVPIVRGRVDVAGLERLVEQLIERGDHDEARGRILAARAADPGRAELLVLYAELAMTSGAWSEAADRWRQVLQLFGDEGPEEVHARLSLALRNAGASVAAREVRECAPPMRTPSGRIALGFEHAAAAMSERRYEDAAVAWRGLMAEPALDGRTLRIVREALTSSQRAQGRTPDEDLWPERLLADDHAEHYPDRLPTVVGSDAMRSGRPLACTVLVGAGPASIEALRSTVRSLEAQEDVDVRLIVETSGPHEVEGIGRAVDGSDIAQVEVIVADGTLPPLESARRLSSGDAVLLLEAGTLLRPDALATMCAALADGPDLRFVYADEDALDADGRRQHPMLKPDWDPDLLLAQPYLGCAVVFRQESVDAVGGVPALVTPLQHPEHRHLFTVWSLAVRIANGPVAAEGTVASPRVHHVPEVLLHRPRGGDRADWTAGPTWTSEAGAAEGLVLGSLAQAEVEWVVEAAPWGMPLRVGPALPARPVRVSVIVPTRDRPELLERCTAGVLGSAPRSASSADDHPLEVELVIVDNDTVDPDAVALIERLAEDERVRVVPGPGEFNFSRLVNLGVAAATGEVCLLLNNDVSPTHDDWMEELVRHALRPEVGVVGALLLHADSRIQHAGVIVGVNGSAEHAFREWPAASAGYLALLRSTRRVSAVTAACMAVRREVYLGLGGLDEIDLPVELSDIDLCLRAAESGLAVLWTPHARLHHVEGGTRARKDDGGSTAGTDLRLQAVESQRSSFQRRWEHRLHLDPHYHPALADSGATYLLRPVT